MSVWTWRFENAEGSELSEQAMQAAGLSSVSFPNQAEAESWVGEEWPRLLTAGVEAVTLIRDDDVVYASMSLRPAE